jgi:hypothetical protein
MQRKAEIMSCELPNGTEAKIVTLKFQRLTIGQEEQFAEELQSLIVKETKRLAASLSTALQIQLLQAVVKDCTAGSCSLTGNIGAQKAMEGAGMRLFLKLAASETHPDMDDETLHYLQSNYWRDCMNVVQSLAPAAAAIAAEEKKRESGDPK